MRFVSRVLAWPLLLLLAACWCLAASLPVTLPLFVAWLLS